MKSEKKKWNENATGSWEGGIEQQHGGQEKCTMNKVLFEYEKYENSSNNSRNRGIIYV